MISSFFCNFSCSVAFKESAAANSVLISGRTKKLASEVEFDNRSNPLSVGSIEFIFSSITKNRSSVTKCMFLPFSAMYWFSVFCNKVFIPCSLRNLINALFLGSALYACNNLNPPSFSFPLEINFFASEIIAVKRFFCSLTNFWTCGFNSSNSWSSPFGVGPEIIRGVLASSINTESTSSTIA